MEEELGDDASDVHDKWLDTIGNLTLSAYNSELKNRPFGEKKRILGESNFELNKWVAQQPVWNAETIPKRAEDLAERALQIWPRPTYT